MDFGSGKILGNLLVTRAFQAKDILATGSLKTNKNILDDGLGNMAVWGSLSSVSGHDLHTYGPTNMAHFSASAGSVGWVNSTGTVILQGIESGKIVTKWNTLDNGSGKSKFTDQLTISGTYAPILEFIEGDQATDEKGWWIVPDSKSLQIRTVNDANNSNITAMSIVRGSGINIASVSFPTGALYSKSNVLDNGSGRMEIITNSDSAQLKLTRTGSSAGSSYLGVAGNELRILDSSTATKFTFNTSSGSFSTLNNTFDDGTGKTLIASDLTVGGNIIANKSSWAILAYSGGSAGITNHPASAWGLRVVEATNPQTYTNFNTLDDGTGKSFFGNPSYGYLSFTFDSNYMWIQGSNAAKNAAKPIKLSGLNGVTTGVYTYNSVLDNGSGKMGINIGSSSPVITLAIGDTDTGFNWNSDGNFDIKNNGVTVANSSPANVDFKVSLTRNGNVIWGSDNDGSGSGSDSDLLDGLHLSQIRGGIPNQSNLDTNFVAGTYSYNNTSTGTPNSGGWGIIDVRVSAGDTYNGADNWLFQLATTTDSTPVKFHRSKINGAGWSSWIKIWDSGNFDPNSKANLSGAAFTGGISAPSFTGNTAWSGLTGKPSTLSGYGINDAQFFQSGRDFTNGTLIETDINYAVSSGDPFLLEIEGNSYGGIVPFSIKVQGYIYSDSIINKGGISSGRGITGIVAINYNNHLCFWFPRQDYWQGFNVFVNSSNGSNGSTSSSSAKRNRVISITDVAKPVSATKEVSFTIYQAWTNQNFDPNTKANLIGAAFTGAVSATSFTGPLYGYKAVDNSNEMTLANGFAGGGLWLNYRGASSAITYVNIGNGLGNSGLAGVNAKYFQRSDVTVVDTNGYLYYNGQNTDDRYLGKSAKAADSDKLDNLDSSSFMRYTGWVNSPGYDANTIAENQSGFTYSNNAPANGPLVHIASGGYGMQFNAMYSSTSGLYFRTRNGDLNSWNAWYQIWTAASFNPSGKLDAGAQAVDSAKLGGIVAANYWHSGNFNPSSKMGSTGGANGAGTFSLGTSGWTPGSETNIIGSLVHTSGSGNGKFMIYSNAGAASLYVDGTVYVNEGANAVWNSGNFDPNSKLGVSAQAADSNLLNGISGSNYARANYSYSSTTFNDTTNLLGGIYRNDGSGILNGNGTVFQTGWYHVIHMHHAGDGYSAQIIVPLSPGSENVFWRRAAGTTWNGWRQFWDSTNAPISTSNSSNTIVQRDASGHTYANYVFSTIFNDAWSAEDSGNTTHFIVKQGDGYHRNVSKAKARQILSVLPTYSGSDPGGLEYGQMWLRTDL